MVTTPGIDVGICWSFPGETPESGLPRLRDHGFDGIELWPQALEEFGASRWAAALQAGGMRCLQLCPYFNFVHGPEKIASSYAMLDDYLAVARVLDCRRLRVFTGPPWGEGVIGAQEATAAQWDDSIRCLREFCDIAARQGVELCLECHEGSLMEDAPSALRLLHAVDRPNLTTNLQLPLLREDWSRSLELLAPYTTHIHIHNWRDGMGIGPLTYLSEGGFDWLPVVRHLVHECGKHVTLSLEHIDHAGRHDPWETARRDGPYLNRLRHRLAAAPREYPMMVGRSTAQARNHLNLQPFQALHDCGVRLFHLDATCSEDIYHPAMRAWQAPDRFDYTAQETQWRRLLESCPDGRLCLRLYVASPPWWDELHPDELQRYADGSVEHEFWHTQRRTIPSLASTLWRTAAVASVQRFLAWLDATGWAERVWGFLLSYGLTWEWGILGSDDFVDYSSPMQHRFRAWLHQEYGDHEALQRAWGDAGVNLDNAAIPTSEQRLRATGDFREFPRDRAAFDFQRCLSATNAEYLLALAGAVRDHAGDRYAVGAFYGYTMTAREFSPVMGQLGPGGLSGGHHALARVQASGLLDFVGSPYTYADRELGTGLLVQHYPWRGAQEHGLRGYDENDLWTFTNQPSHGRPISIGSTANLADSIRHQRLALGTSLCRGTDSWWYDLTDGPASYNYSDPTLLAELRRQRELFTALRRPGRRTSAQIALVIDERAKDALGLESKLFLHEVYRQLPQWAWCGAPFDVWLASDITAMNMAPYKLAYVFAPYLDAAALQQLQLALCHSGRTVWWAPHTGHWSPAGRDATAFTALTGFAADDVDTTKLLHRFVAPSSVPASLHPAPPSVAPASAPASSHPAPPSVAPASAPASSHPAPPSLAPSSVSASSHPVPPSVAPASVPASLRDVPTGSISSQNPVRADWTSLYGPCAGQGSETLANIAANAGVHLYGDAPIQIIASDDLVCVHVREAGDYALNLPAGLWTEVFTGRAVQAGQFEFAARDVALFHASAS